ncbi:MAG: PspC domain-containing protein [Actinomycetia bacterium]|nr:PspC domain-containing protein [Actinomycetes bacterium]
MEKRLYRSRTDRVVAGVCGGLADYLDIDPTLLRILVAVGMVLTRGGLLLAYVIMAVVVPEEPLGNPQEGTPPQGTGQPATSAQVPASPLPFEPAAQSKVVESGSTSRARSRGVRVGIALVVVGVLLLVERFTDLDIWRFWPVVIIALGISAIAKGVRR